MTFARIKISRIQGNLLIHITYPGVHSTYPLDSAFFPKWMNVINLNDYVEPLHFYKTKTLVHHGYPVAYFNYPKILYFCKN